MNDMSTELLIASALASGSGGGGGGGGTTNYNALSNKPKINGVELTGDKTGRAFNLGNAVMVYTNEGRISASDDPVIGVEYPYNDHNDYLVVQNHDAGVAIGAYGEDTGVYIDDVLTNKTYVDEAVNGKQDALESGTNIKTINNQSLLGSGNIQIEGGETPTIRQVGEASTERRDRTFLCGTSSPNMIHFGGVDNDAVSIGSGKFEMSGSYGEELSIALGGDHAENPQIHFDEYYVKPALKAALDVPNLYADASSFDDGENGVAVARRGDGTAFDDPSYAIIVSGNQNSAHIKTVRDQQTAVDVEVPSLGYVDDALGDKQDTLVSGTNIKTINGQPVLGSGNIDIQGGGSGVESFVVTSYDERTGSYTLANEKTWEDISGAVANNKDVKLVFTDSFDGQNIYETLSLVGYNTVEEEKEDIVELIFSNERSLFTEDVETVTVGNKGFYVDLYPNILRKYESNGSGKFVKEHLIPRTNIESSSLTMKNDYSADYHDYANVFTISESENGVGVGVTVYGEPTMDVELTSKDYVDGAVEGKADKSDTYTKTQTDALIEGEHIELTQAEYDALTDEEKNNGKVYFITDGGAYVPAVDLIPYVNQVPIVVGKLDLRGDGEFRDIKRVRLWINDLKNASGIITAGWTEEGVYVRPIRIYGWFTFHDRESTQAGFKTVIQQLPIPYSGYMPHESSMGGTIGLKFYVDHNNKLRMVVDGKSEFHTDDFACVIIDFMETPVE